MKHADVGTNCFYNIFNPDGKFFFLRDLFAGVMSVHNSNCLSNLIFTYAFTLEGSESGLWLLIVTLYEKTLCAKWFNQNWPRLTNSVSKFKTVLKDGKLLRFSSSKITYLLFNPVLRSLYSTCSIVYKLYTSNWVLSELWYSSTEILAVLDSQPSNRLANYSF